MRRYTVLSLVLCLLLFASTSPAVSDTYYIYSQYGGTWQDANKSGANPEDDLMCWAAAASNILAWGNWGTTAYNTSALIFQHFQDHWTDNTGYMSWAWQWWFDASPPPYYTGSYPDVPGGGNFYPTLNFNNYYAYSSGGNVMSAIDTLLHQGYGVTLVISKTGQPYSHAITCWGFGYSTPGVYTSIYITDSDDGVLALRNYLLSWHDDAWYLGGSYDGWKITSVQALGYLSLGYLPTPIAPSWVLFGTGVFSIFLLRRRRRPGRKETSPF